MPVKFLPRKKATRPVVELPVKGSKILSPFLVLAEIILFNNSAGF